MSIQGFQKIWQHRVHLSLLANSVSLNVQRPLNSLDLYLFRSNHIEQPLEPFLHDVVLLCKDDSKPPGLLSLQQRALCDVNSVL